MLDLIRNQVRVNILAARKRKLEAITNSNWKEIFLRIMMKSKEVVAITLRKRIEEAEQKTLYRWNFSLSFLSLQFALFFCRVFRSFIVTLYY